MGGPSHHHRRRTQRTAHRAQSYFAYGTLYSTLLPTCLLDAILCCTPLPITFSEASAPLEPCVTTLECSKRRAFGVQHGEHKWFWRLIRVSLPGQVRVSQPLGSLSTVSTRFASVRANVLARIQSLLPNSMTGPALPSTAQSPTSPQPSSPSQPRCLKVRIVTWNMHDSLPKVCSAKTHACIISSDAVSVSRVIWRSCWDQCHLTSRQSNQLSNLPFLLSRQMRITRITSSSCKPSPSRRSTRASLTVFQVLGRNALASRAFRWVWVPVST
jgi:hypothetical protein